MDVDKALRTQLANIQKKTGKSLDELAQVVRASGLTRHGQIRDMLKERLGLGDGDGNTLAHVVLESDGSSAADTAGRSETDVLAAIYAGPKAYEPPIIAYRITLAGLAKKNGIMMVDFAVDAQKQGKTPAEAIHEACLSSVSGR